MRKLIAAGVGCVSAFTVSACPPPPPERFDIAYIEQTPYPAHLRFMSASGQLSPPVYLPNGMAVHVSGHHSLSWSPDGRSLAFAAGTPADLNIYTIDASGVNLRQLTQSTSRDESPAWSPDGTRVAFLTNRHDVYERDVYLIDVNTLAETRVTQSSDNYISPVWAPDNGRIAYAKNVSFTAGDEIFTHDLSSGAATQVGTLPGGMLAQGLQWSPSQNTFLFYVPGTFADVWRVGTDGVGLQNLTADMSIEASSQPAWYAGDQVLFIRAGSGVQTGLYRMSATGTGKALIGATDGFPWGPAFRATAVDLPDLVVSSHSSTFDTADPVAPRYVVRFRIRNAGTASSTAALVYVDALDPDPPPGTSTQQLQQSRTIAALASGEETAELEVSFLLSEIHAKDVHAMRVMADPKNTVAEAFETNNSALWTWP